MTNISYDFSGRSVIVTGAGRGIGLAVAQAFSAAGARVAIVDTDSDAVREAAASIGALGLTADVSATDQVQRAVAKVVGAHGGVDVVVNNAGIVRDRVLWKLTDDDWEAVLGVHLGGTFRVTRACTRHLRQSSAGRIVNVTSYTGLHGNFGQANYAAAKAGIVGFTKTAAKELAPFGITVNAISPNADTRMIASIPADRRQEIEATIPLGRFARPDEMTGAVLYLASDAAAYVTGVTLPVDGGVSM